MSSRSLGSHSDGAHAVIGRRLILKAVAGLALGQADPSSARPKEGDLIVKAEDSTRTPLRTEDVALGAAQTLAWAMDPSDRTVRNGSRLNQLILVRLDPATLGPDTRARAADGVVAYTSICTHTGCDVDD